MLRPTAHTSGARRAFTLLELIVAILLLAILSALAIPTFTQVISSSKNAASESTMSSLVTDATSIARLRVSGPAATYSIDDFT